MYDNGTMSFSLKISLTYLIPKDQLTMITCDPSCAGVPSQSLQQLAVAEEQTQHISICLLRPSHDQG